MSGCRFCEKEESILSVTGSQIPVGQRCYTKLISKDVVWDEKTKLGRLEDVLKIG